MALRGPGTRRTASGDPEESIKVDVMDTRSVRSGGHNLKGPLESLGVCIHQLGKRKQIHCTSCGKKPDATKRVAVAARGGC
jgi:hypothetical protein